MHRDFCAVINLQRSSDELSHLFLALESAWYPTKSEVRVTSACHTKIVARSFGVEVNEFQWGENDAGARRQGCGRRTHKQRNGGLELKAGPPQLRLAVAASTQLQQLIQQTRAVSLFVVVDERIKSEWF